MNSFHPFHHSRARASCRRATANRGGQRHWRWLAGLLGLALVLGLGLLPTRWAKAAFIYEGTLLVGNRANDNVLRIDPATDTVVQTITHADFGGLNEISDVEVDPATGNIYVAVSFGGVSGGGEVVVFDAFGAFLRVVPLPPDVPTAGLNHPFGIDVDADGSTWLARPNAGQVARVAINGTLLGLFDVGDNPEDVLLGGPARPGILFLTNSDRSVSPPGNPRVDRLDTTTGIVTPLATLPAGVLPLGLDLFDANTIGVASAGVTANTRVDHFDADTGASVGPTSFFVVPLFVDYVRQPGGDYFVSDFAGDRVTEFSPAGVVAANLVGDAAPNDVSDPIGLALAVEPPPGLRYSVNQIFGTACAGDSVVRELTVANTANYPISVLDVARAAGSTNFSVDPLPTRPVLLQPGQHIAFLVRFQPSGAAGARSATIRVTSTDPIEPLFEFTVAGTVGRPRVNATTLGSGEGGFGTVCTGDTKDVVLQVRNEGTCDLTITNISRFAGSADFIVAATLRFPIILSPDAHVDVPIRFRPTSFGPNAATFRVVSDDPTFPTVLVDFTGTGGQPDINVSPTTLAFGDVCQGVEETRTLQVHNTSECTLTIADIARTAGSTDFSVVPPQFPFVLSGNASVDVQIVVNASSQGPRSATFTITSDDPDEPALAVEVTADAGPGDINVSPQTLLFGEVCVGDSKTMPLELINQGGCALNVTSIARVAGSAEFEVANPQLPLVLSHDASVPVNITFTPTAPFGVKTATFEIASDDPDEPLINVVVTGTVGTPDINVSPPALAFGEVCTGDSKTLPLELINQGGCTLNVTSIARVAGSAEFEVANPQLPLVLSHDASVPVNITFTPTAPFGVKTATFEIASDDPDEPLVSVVVTGSVGTPDIRVQNCPLDFGTVSFPVNAEAQIQICNVGRCDLNVTQVAFVPPTADFQIVEASPTPGSPLVVSKDFCIPFHVRFTPTSAGVKVANIQIISDDPDQPVIDCPVTGNTLIASLADLDVPAGIAFRPTVIQQHGNCFTDAFPAISNNGIGVIAISNVALTGENPGDFELVGLPSQPILLGPGDVLGAGGFVVRFRPTAQDRDRRANLVLTVVDPITLLPIGDATIPLCGEGVRPGGRVLILRNGVPAARVKRLILERLQEEDGPRGDFEKIWERTNVPPTTVTPGFPCLPFTFHAEWGGVDSFGFPGYLRPARYRVKATVRVNGKDRTKFINFEVTECTFNDGLFLVFP